MVRGIQEQDTVIDRAGVCNHTRPKALVYLKGFVSAIDTRDSELKVIKES